MPLFCDELHTVVTDEEKAGRVWRGLQKKVSSSALGCLTQSWLSELPEVGMLIFRYIRKAIDAPRSIETNFGDPDVLQLVQIWKKVDGERVHLMQFVRFQAGYACTLLEVSDGKAKVDFHFGRGAKV